MHCACTITSCARPCHLVATLGMRHDGLRCARAQVILTIMMGSYSSCLAEPHVCVKSSISGTDGRGAYAWNADGTCDYSSSDCRSDLLACQIAAAKHINVCVSPVSTLNSISSLITIVGCAWCDHGTTTRILRALQPARCESHRHRGADSARHLRSTRCAS